MLFRIRITKKIIFTLFLSLIFSYIVLAQEQKRYSFSIVPTVSATLGQMNESIYSSKGYKCSLLEWEQKPLWNCGVELQTSFCNFAINTSLEYSLPKKCGKMYDSDWNDSGIKTTYSIHELKAETNLNTEIEFLYSINIKKILSLKPFIQAQYSYNSFEARNGEGWYGSAPYSATKTDVPWYDENAAHYKVYGIDYRRHTFHTFAGLYAQFNIFSRLSAGVSFAVSPFTYTSAIDHHHGKYNDFHFQEIQYGYFSRFKTEINIAYSVNSLLDIGFYFQALLGAEDTGDLYTDYWTENLTLVDNQKSGADIQSYKLGLFVKIKILK